MASDNISKEKINLRIGSESDQDIVMTTVLNANAQDQILNLCLRCTNYVMINRSSITENVPQHKCVVRNATCRLKNLGFCMHKITDAIVDGNFDGNISMPPLRCYPNAVEIPTLSRIVAASNSMSAGDFGEISSKSHYSAFTTSTPKSVLAR